MMMKQILFTLALFFSIWGVSAQDTNSKNALYQYVNRQDNSYQWKLNDTLKGEGWTAHRLILTSQTWRDLKWMHELVVIVPERLTHQEVLLHVAGGSADDKTGFPNLHKWDDSAIKNQTTISARCEAVTAVLWQVPRQPLMGGKYEDELLSYTLHQFQQDGDYTWPLLFPMVKSVVKAMDAVGEFVMETCRKEANRFVVTGYSKRGWTTWMTAGTGDPRVVAIAPMVIDILNMPVSVPYQRHMFGGYSIQIQDYVNLGLTEELATSSGLELVDMIDPYSYRAKYTMPKMVFLGTNDEYWTVDAVKNYIDGIPGEKYTSYVTNAGHGLGQDATTSLEAFFYQTIHGKEYPCYEYKIKEKGGKIHLDIKADKDLLADVLVWEACSENKDFRKKKFEPTSLGISGKKKFSVDVAYPKEGYKAFLVMLKYKHPSMPGATYNITTRMFTASPNELFEEAFSLKD